MRKFVQRTIAFALLICALLTVSVYAEEAVITGSDVNFRSGPGTDYAIIDCLPKGAVVTVEDRSNGEWYSVTYNGQTGFIYASYLSIAEAPAPTPDPAPAASPEEPAAVSNGSGTINAMYVRFRSGPGTDYSILGEYNTGASVEVTGAIDGWYAVVINGTAGYVYADYVTLSDNVTVPAETPQPTPEPTPAPTPAPAPEPTEVVTGQDFSGHIQGDYVYFRSGPGTSYSIFDCLDNGTALTITGTSGEWTAVTINGQAGYVYSSYVISESGELPSPVETPQPTPEPIPVPVDTYTPTEGYISGNTVRFRSQPSTQSDILGEYNYGNPLTITGTSGEWKAVVIDGQSGYVYSQYVTEGRVTDIGDDPNVSDLGRQVVEYALQFEGCPYVWGGMSPDGFDCSGFTSYVYAHFGITLNRVACDQANNGVEVDISALQPGDILCFYSSSDYIGHVGIYIGNNKFIHASTYTTGVIISELSGYYNTRGFIARRIV